MFIKFIKFFILSIVFISPTSADQLKVFEFTEKEIINLEIRKVRNAKANTSYSVGRNDRGNYLRAEANSAASGLGKEIKINLDQTPFINITWKVEKDLSGINEQSKKGHDFAARVFVLSTTKENLNEWVTVKANVKKHFKQLHNLDVNELNGIAIMSDTDNSKRKAIAYYQNIYFSSE